MIGRVSLLGESVVADLWESVAVSEENGLGVLRESINESS